MGELPMPTQEAVIPFAPASTSTTSGNADKLDRAGQTILQLLNRAASVAEDRFLRQDQNARRGALQRR
jgi:hypothetical protein